MNLQFKSSLKESSLKSEEHSRSEITLFNLSESLLDKEELDLDTIISEKYKPDERMHLIINRTKGKIFDTRYENIETFLDISSNNSYLQLPTKPSFKKHCFSNEEDLESVLSNSPVEGKQSKKLDRFPEKEVGTKFERGKSKSLWGNNWKEIEKLHLKILEAVIKNDEKQLCLMLNQKHSATPIDINYKFQSNWTLLHHASMNSTIQIFSRIINYPNINVNSINDFQRTALHVAAELNRLENCELLISANINIDAQDQDLNSALHIAAELGHKQLVELLLKNAAQLNLKNSQNLTPAELCRSSDIIDLFPKQHQEPVEEENLLFRNRKTHRHMIEKMLMSGLGEKQPKKQMKAIKIEKDKEKEKEKENKSAVQTRRKNILKLYEFIKQNSSIQPITLSSFKFYKKIGEGAFGEVYVVRKGKHDKLYALKAIKKERVFGTSLYRYIQTEKQILSLINHPFIVRLHYAFQTETHLFLVMDYCQGGDLSKVLEKKKKLDQKTVKAYASEILLGVEILHKNNIIYRDMKPENIVLDKDGHALLTDFGLSKKTQNLNDLNKSFCGTPAYLPLEIINKKGHNRMADWYEFGVVLYELFTGVPPFYADTKAELYDQVRQGMIRFPKNTPEIFRDLIKKLLAQNPDKRLGFEDDAESIKEHPWFADVNWDAVLDRRQVMPPIENRIKIGEPIRTKFQDVKSVKFNMASWSFVS